MLSGALPVTTDAQVTLETPENPILSRSRSEETDGQFFCVRRL